MVISPWAYEAKAVSPDGALVAEVGDLGEIAMGGPTSGRLHLSNGLTLPDASPSIVWSEDSEYLAVPVWTLYRQQRLVVISMSRRDSRYAPGTYRVLELARFEGGVIEGTDSPAHQPRPVSIAADQIQW